MRASWLKLLAPLCTPAPRPLADSSTAGNRQIEGRYRSSRCLARLCSSPLPPFQLAKIIPPKHRKPTKKSLHPRGYTMDRGVPTRLSSLVLRSPRLFAIIHHPCRTNKNGRNQNLNVHPVDDPARQASEPLSTRAQTLYCLLAHQLILYAT